MSDSVALVLVTCGSEAEARSLARQLVEGRLAAGVQIIPISSIYTWKDEVVEDQEHLLICKTRTALYDAIESTVTEHHSYEVPPILLLEIDRQVTRIRSGSSPVPARRELLPPPLQPTTVGQGELSASQSRVSSSCCVSYATRVQRE
jgi:periplasmic divalent cation tolerance protein